MHRAYTVFSFSSPHFHQPRLIALWVRSFRCKERKIRGKKVFVRFRANCSKLPLFLEEKALYPMRGVRNFAFTRPSHPVRSSRPVNSHRWPPTGRGGLLGSWPASQCPAYSPRRWLSLVSPTKHFPPRRLFLQFHIQMRRKSSGNSTPWESEGRRATFPFHVTPWIDSTQRIIRDSRAGEMVHELDSWIESGRWKTRPS